MLTTRTITTIILIGVVIITVFYVFIPFLHISESSNQQYHIAILKTASHPALDQAEQGFQEILQEKRGDNITFETKNADGSIAALDIISDAFVYNPSISLFYAIATPALQAIAQKEQVRPIIFSAVTDPSDLQLEQQHNICGITDFIDADAQLSLIMKLYPTAKTVAVLFNNAEINSIKALSRIKTACKKQNITVIEVGVLQAFDITSALEQKAQNADLILTPTDNLVALSISVIATFSKTHHIPLIVSDNTLLSHGAVASCGVDYVQLGRKAGEIALLLLEKQKNSAEIGYQTTPLSPLFVHKNTFNSFKDILFFDPMIMTMTE